MRRVLGSKSVGRMVDMSPRSTGVRLEARLDEARWETKSAAMKRYITPDPQIGMRELALVKAAQEGVTIISEDPNDLKRAEWNTQKDRLDIPAVAEAYIPNIELTELRENAQRYEEMAWDIPQKRIDEAKMNLRKLTLFHMSNRLPIERYNPSNTKLMPFSSICEMRGSTWEQSRLHNSFRLDKHLGLTEYVFMSYGAPDTAYGSRGIQISADMLEDERCIASPSDIRRSVDAYTFHRGIEIPEDMETVAKYRASLVTGRDWLEILARRIARHPGDMTESISMSVSEGALGEIKYRGTIPPKYIMDYLDVSSSWEA